MSKSGSPSDKRRRVEPEAAPAQPAAKKPAARKTPDRPETAPLASAKPAGKKAPAKKKPAKKRAPAKRKVGRPSLYSQELVNAILEKIADGKFLTEICADPAMPSCSTVFKWRLDYPEFSEAYAHAREAAADKMVIETVAIADDGINDTYIDAETGERRTDHDVIQRSKLRVETRKWLLARMAPKTYGDRIETVHSGEIKKTSDLTDEELDAQIAARQAALQEGDGE
ncbi:terminase small subunit-like protein [Cupriavidus numazuensis]|uniref:Terminase small subunit n=1 Tax=Cupriavidus numazuensis TaxID=221992 RepID=A0ABN7PR82_9BURK|nr:hypothetical protein [Cupriavidus numazuensis]CAG2132445.1 hypothetical protein LMG26411_00619 [Cupriavidus numazuensis]